MIYFFDTSALIKRYIIEAGSEKADFLFSEAERIIISPVTKIEAFSTLKRLEIEKAITKEDHKKLKEEINLDFDFFTILSLNQDMENKCVELIDKYQLKTLDSIQLASCLIRKDEVTNFIVADSKLKSAALSEKLDVIDPTQ